MSKTALLSVYDKSNVEPFARKLVERFGYTLIATGGTYRVLKEAGLAVTELAELTGFEKLLDGRVKSLHPHVFAGILAKRDQADHMAQIEQPIDMVVVNLYPFEAGLKDSSNDEADMLELVDIGGVSLLRAAAKNHPAITVVASPDFYEPVLHQLTDNEGDTNPEFRRLLAAEAFRRTMGYDKAISSYLTQQAGLSEDETIQELQDTVLLKLHKAQPMRYGENPHQPAALYSTTGKLNYELHNGKPLSYNNILDLEAAWSLICEFQDEPACAVIKHTTPCGTATGKDAFTAYEKALASDPLSAFGGIVAFNTQVCEKTAKALKEMFLEVLVAPEFTPEALGVLKGKKNLRVVTRPLATEEHPATYNNGLSVRQVSPSLFLAQVNSYEKADGLLQENLKVVTEKKPTEEQLRAMAFAWRVAKHVKSNAIVVAQPGRTVGISGGQTSRVGAMEQALAQACDEAKDAVLASDGFFPAVDNIEAAAQSRVAAIIQPGGSIKDQAVIDACNQYGIAMVTTGVREFRH